MGCTFLTDFAPEGGTFSIEVKFYDEEPKLVTPKSANWTLTDLLGNVINNRQEVSISPLSSTVILTLEGDDLAILDTDARRQVNGCVVVPRMLLVEYVYDSDLGTDRIGRQQQGFYIKDLVAVS